MTLPVVIPNEFANATASIPLSQLDSNFSTLANVVNQINAGTQQLSNANVAILIVNAGTSAAPTITTTGDTNTGIFFPAADTIAFAEGGAEAMRIDSSGNVGIGTTSPSQKLTVQGLISTKDSSGADIVQIGDISSTLRIQGRTSLPMTFWVNDTERMRITSAGNVGIGTTSPGAKLSVAGIIGFDSGSVRSLDYPNVTASTGFVDITVSTSCLGFMAIMNRRFDDGTPSTNRTYSIFFANGNASFQQIHEYAEGGGASFTVTSPSAGVIRITNTYVLNSDIEVLLMIRNTSTI